MSDFQTVHGFEDAWRPPVLPQRRTPLAILTLRGSATGDDVRARLTRITGRAPEVMVKVTGRTRDPSHLRAHLDYISRNGELEMEDREGALITGRPAVRELADDWSAIAFADSRRRTSTPFSLSVVLSMPADTDAAIVRDAARAFAREVFADRFDYVFALHTDAQHPHVHLAVRALGDQGERLNPKKADLESWRQLFAQALRDRGVEAEATPRRARGITRKSERGPLRRMRQRYLAGQGALARVQAEKLREAARTAVEGAGVPQVWEVSIVQRQRTIRSLYLAQAQLLGASSDLADRRLGEALAAFVRKMPSPDTERLWLSRQLRDLDRLRAADMSKHRSGEGDRGGRSR